MDQRIDVVRGFCAAWTGGTGDSLAQWFSADGVYHNIPSPPATGRQEIRDLIAGYLEKFAIEIRILHLAADGDVVLTERVDDFLVDGRRISLPVMGACEVRAGQISAWRDYFDREQFWSLVRAGA
jgi:limonene-1,2-epoxide hydrolase